MILEKANNFLLNQSSFEEREEESEQILKSDTSEEDIRQGIINRMTWISYLEKGSELPDALINYLIDIYLPRNLKIKKLLIYVQ